MSFEIHRGTNISHWLSQSQRRGDERRAWFTRGDVERIAGFGFDHIRLPVDEEQLWSPSMGRESEAFDLLGSALEWCTGAGLRAVVDLHILRSHHFNNVGVPALYADPAERERFGSLWDDLSRFLDPWDDDMVAFELLNEAVAPSPDVWNQTWRMAYDAVRERSASRPVVLGSNNFNSYETFPGLDVPDDSNLILTFHYYHPMFVTHHTAKWWRDGGSYAGPIRYPGRPIPESQHRALDRLTDDGLERLNRDFDRDVMLADFRIPLKIAREHSLPLYCGEFGCYENTPPDIREAWYGDVIDSFTELGIAWANWDYKGSFGIIGEGGRETGVRSWLMR